MIESAAETEIAGHALPPLSADEKNIVAALFSWMKNHPGAPLAEFDTAYRRAKRLAGAAHER